MFENEIEQDEWEYTEGLKAEPHKRYEYYQSGGKVVTATEVDEQINTILQSEKNK